MTSTGKLPTESAYPFDTSLWLARDRAAALPPLEGLHEVDVAVIGGGIVGVTTALLLANEGRSVVLVEGQRIGGGATGNSTAKLSIQHGSKMSELIKADGEDTARDYVHANQAALDVVRHWVGDHLDECGMRSVTSWLWASSDAGEAMLRAEAAAAATLGIDTVWDEGRHVPFATLALGIERQLLIEPALLLDRLVSEARRLGATVAEGSLATDIQPGEPHAVTLATGATIRARHLVLATHVPMLDRTGVFAACDYRRSHAVAMPLEGAGTTQLPDMYTGVESDGFSLRPAIELDGRAVVVAAGDGHALTTPEQASHADDLVRRVRAATGADEPCRGWITHDAFPTDRRPLAGAARGGDRLYVATGFSGWGLSNGVAAALTITSLAQRGHARWSRVFDPTRLAPFTKPSIVKGAAHVVKGLVIDRGTAITRTVDSIEPGHGDVVGHAGRLVAAVRHEDGSLLAVDAACTHQGCLVQYDGLRSCWQCPCHGSRFALDGAVLEGPASKPLERVDVTS